MKSNDDVVLVTGAGSGMGQLAATRAAEQGQQVVGFDVNESALLALSDRHPNIHTYVVDITDLSKVESTVKKVNEEIGCIKRLINCAGIMPLGTLNSQDALEIRRIMDVNYIGTVNINKAVMPYMLDRECGEIINFASMAGWSPLISVGAYNAAKFAVVAFTEVLYHENKYTGVKVCCVCPPPVNTPLLRNAVNRPKAFDVVSAVEPSFILDAMESSINKGKWLCIPGWQSKAGYLARRFAPNLLWKVIHYSEGKDLTHLSLSSRKTN
ncbi:SDR family NAD(P)-dependent oxidoreductase [Spongiibacter marinus]|uniref:SDR family NAD(P)-dependent oxidoreductase n=1 Tax=Spongiibacter marinus TaxID=354246 RepID=UPI0035BE986E